MVSVAQDSCANQTMRLSASRQVRKNQPPTAINNIDILRIYIKKGRARTYERW